MSELFALPESLSPKLKWLRAHGLDTHHFPEYADLPESPETGKICYPWICYMDCWDDKYDVNFKPGEAETEEDAIWDYCRKNNLPHYSLSDAPPKP